jgi:hypothetical protein
MARRQEHLSAYLRICLSGRQQNHKKIKKNQERIIRHHLKKMFLRVLMRICVSAYFLKKSQPQGLQAPQHREGQPSELAGRRPVCSQMVLSPWTNVVRMPSTQTSNRAAAHGDIPPPCLQRAQGGERNVPLGPPMASYSPVGGKGRLVPKTWVSLSMAERVEAPVGRVGMYEFTCMNSSYIRIHMDEFTTDLSLFSTSIRNKYFQKESHRPEVIASGRNVVLRKQF